MKNDDLREAVARAICEATGCNPDRLVNKSIPMWQISALKEADDAIAVVVEVCAQVADRHAYDGEMGVSAQRAADEIRALARKE